MPFKKKDPADLKPGKVCSKCGEWKPRSEYYIRERNKMQSACKSCRSKAAAASAKARKSRDPAYRMLTGARKRHYDCGVPFDLKVEDIHVPERCPVFDKPLVMDDPSSEWYPNLDKITPHLGYVRGNIVVMSARANRIKNDATLEELKALVAFMEKETAGGLI